ncbi:hypothetical protein JYK22_23135, partial [Nonomuraea sp. RK-328]|nr:hypothetical protein [Nonomuraea sp. RK-328]
STGRRPTPAAHRPGVTLAAVAVVQFMVSPGIGPALTGIEFLPFVLGVVAGSVLAVKFGYRLAPRTLLVAAVLIALTVLRPVHTPAN